MLTTVDVNVARERQGGDEGEKEIRRIMGYKKKKREKEESGKT